MNVNGVTKNQKKGNIGVAIDQQICNNSYIFPPQNADKVITT